MPKNIYVGFDRDGTLEMPGHPVPTQLMEQFSKLEKMGIKLFLASGKDFVLLKDIVTDIKLNTWMICAENGGHIVIPAQKIDYVQPSNIHMSSFIAKIHELQLPPHQEEPKRSIWSKKFGTRVLEAEKLIKNFISDQGWELNVYSHPDGDGGLDVVPPGIDKINLLPYLPEDATVYYVGDAENDLGLLSHRRVIPCTVANAKTSIQKVVREKNGYISSKSAGYGVSELMTQLFSV